MRPFPFPTEAYSKSLHRFSQITAVATFVLILAGALVVGHEAGLAVPDWPLSFGMVMPPMVGGVFYEHGHRMIAATVGLLTVVLAVWTWRAERRRWVRAVAWLGVGAVILQGVLGGLTVLYKLPTPVVVGHACLAQLFFCITLTLAVVTGESWRRAAGREAEDPHSPSFRQLTAATSLALVIQLALGAALRHRALDVVPHLIGAGIACFMAGWVVLHAMTRLREQPPLQRLAMLLGIVLIVQLSLGAISYFTLVQHNGRSPVDPVMIWATSAHVAVGALVLGTSWVLTLMSFRWLAAPQTAAVAEAAQKSPA